jgi:hypothetical protein
MESSVSKGEDGVHGHQKASKRRALFVPLAPKRRGETLRLRQM